MANTLNIFCLIKKQAKSPITHKLQNKCFRKSRLRGCFKTNQTKVSILLQINKVILLKQAKTAS